MPQNQEERKGDTRDTNSIQQVAIPLTVAERNHMKARTIPSALGAPV